MLMQGVRCGGVEGGLLLLEIRTEGPAAVVVEEDEVVVVVVEVVVGSSVVVGDRRVEEDDTVRFQLASLHVTSSRMIHRNGMVQFQWCRPFLEWGK